MLLNIVTEKKVPIVAPMGVGDDGKIYNINADTKYIVCDVLEIP